MAFRGGETGPTTGTFVYFSFVIGMTLRRLSDWASPNKQIRAPSPPIGVVVRLQRRAPRVDRSISAPRARSSSDAARGASGRLAARAARRTVVVLVVVEAIVVIRQIARDAADEVDASFNAASLCRSPPSGTSTAVGSGRPRCPVMWVGRSARRDPCSPSLRARGARLRVLGQGRRRSDHTRRGNRRQELGRAGCQCSSSRRPLEVRRWRRTRRERGRRPSRATLSACRRRREVREGRVRGVQESARSAARP